MECQYISHILHNIKVMQLRLSDFTDKHLEDCTIDELKSIYNETNEEFQLIFK